MSATVDDATAEETNTEGTSADLSEAAPEEESVAEETTDNTVEETAAEEASDKETLEENNNYDNAQLQRIIEGAILAAGEPLSILRLQALFGEKHVPEKSDILTALTDIQETCEGRGFDLIEVANGWRFQVRGEVAQWVNRLWDEKPQKYSRALLETLSLIAYRQPITRGDIEEVRGVAVSSHIIKTLSERDWVKVVGHRDVPGRPALYATTKDFLDYFNLKSLEELPTLGELKDIESLNRHLGFEEMNPSGEKTPDSSSETAEGETTEGETTEGETTEGETTEGETTEGETTEGETTEGETTEAEIVDTEHLDVPDENDTEEHIDSETPGELESDSSAFVHEDESAELELENNVLEESQIDESQTTHEGQGVDENTIDQ
ncbi:MAG: SMC-Scp complex subunit ScpB [Agarilytica sp.]